MKMKNKKIEQIANKEKHKGQLKNPRKKEPSLTRSDPSLIKKPTILIVCEGENTEPSYFNQFGLLSVKVEGVGYNTLSLVERALELSQLKNYDQVWCVFDADPKSNNPKQAENFNKAVFFAEKNKIEVAYSNQAFEYWIILHFEDHQGGKMNRKDYNNVINKYLKPFGLEYNGEKDKYITEEIFDILDGIDSKTGKERKQLAITRAKRNYDNFDHSNLANEESSTTVYRLVEELLKYV